MKGRTDKERPANVPRKTKANLDEALDILAGLRNKLERFDEFFKDWGEPFQVQDWMDIRTGLADLEILVFYARQGLWVRRGGTGKLGELNNDKHRKTQGH
jgi:hypothetical protein